VLKEERYNLLGAPGSKSFAVLHSEVLLFEIHKLKIQGKSRRNFNRKLRRHVAVLKKAN
jgi:hypothetical protein